MKYALLIAALIALPAAAETQTNTSNTASDSVSNATNAGNSQSITFTSPGTSSTNVTYGGGTTVSGTTKVKNVPSMAGPALASSNDTCMGSVSGGVSVAGFGVAGGSTIKDTNCIMLKNARELWNMGMRAAALARMCMDAENREALEMTGFTCPQTERERKEAK